MTPNPSAEYVLADMKVKGGIAPFITAKRDAGLSWEAVARELYVATAHAVSVSGVTVRSWHARYIEPEAASA